MSLFVSSEERTAMRFRPLGSALIVSLATAVMAFATLGCSSSGDDTASPIDYGNPDGSTASDGGPDGSTTDGGGGDASACTPKTCVQLGATCGSAPDGCGGKIECGTCPSGQQCGGGGTNKCGTDECAPKTCSTLQASCGYVSDGCSEAINCGTCPAPMTCGGGGKPNQCGCVAKTCAQLGASCGSVPDGCDGMVECGSCPSGQSCGGGGTANTCGAGTCTAKTCAQQGASCGYVTDGCSKALDCGDCSGNEVCGGGGKANQCGCNAKTCVQLGISCGTIDNGCGVQIDCGSCPTGETCGGSGTPGQCGCTCSAPNASTTCSAGSCSIVKCDVGWADCDGDVVNGCEVDIRTSANNCGVCGRTCEFDNASGMCASGQCVLGQCANGFANCDGAAANGCETDTLNDPMHCGSCSKICDAVNGSPACAGGNCGVDCSTGWGDCNSSVVDGCETDLTTDTHHCGACATDCLSPAPDNVADATCTNSSCAVVACNPNAYDMDTSFANGCECIDDMISSDCASALQIPPGTLASGQSTTQSGSIVPTGDEDWFVISFSGNNTCAYHPNILLEDLSGTGSIRIDVATDCGGSLIACSEGGSSSGQLNWEFLYSDTCDVNAALDPTRFPSSPTTVYVRVYALGPSTTCLPYVLHISN